MALIEECIPCHICGGEGWFIVDDEGNGKPGYDESLRTDIK
jgi:ferredoxin